MVKRIKEGCSRKSVREGFGDIDLSYGEDTLVGINAKEILDYLRDFTDFTEDEYGDLKKRSIGYSLWSDGDEYVYIEYKWVPDRVIGGTPKYVPGDVIKSDVYSNYIETEGCHSKKSVKEYFEYEAFQLVDSYTDEIIDVFDTEDAAEAYAREYIKKWATEDDPVAVDCYVLDRGEDYKEYPMYVDEPKYLWTLDSYNGGFFESKNVKKSSKKRFTESKVTGNFHGIPDMKFVWHNTQSDPGVIYDGKYFNANEIDDTLWEEFREYCAETGVIEDYDMFDQWVSENTDYVYDLVNVMIENGNYEELDTVDGVGPFKGGWRSNGNFIQGESKKSAKRKLRISEESRKELSAQNDSRKSFYGKAHVVTDDDGTQILYSYNTPVVEIKGGKVTLKPMWDSSATTLRHVKEFLKQNGFEVGSKAQIAKMYGGANESFKRSNKRK